MTAEVAAQTTVVVAVWDRYVDGLLPKAIESLRAQDLRARIVVVDNASSVELPTLDGIDVVRVRIRATLGAARNVGLEQVSTPYVVFWDADDEMMPGTLAFLENAIRSGSGLAAFGAAIVEDTSGARHRWPRRWMSALARAPRLFALVDCVWSLYPSTGSTILRTAYVRAADGYFDAESGEDWCLGVSLAFRGRIGWSERPGRIYRLQRRVGLGPAHGRARPDRPRPQCPSADRRRPGHRAVGAPRPAADRRGAIRGDRRARPHRGGARDQAVRSGGRVWRRVRYTPSPIATNTAAPSRSGRMTPRPPSSEPVRALSSADDADWPGGWLTA